MNQANPDPPSKDATAEFVGRNWLFQRVDDFLKQEQERYFVVTGEPGIGKSYFAKRLTQNKKIHAYHFCSALEGGSLDPTAFAASMSLQLIRSLPDFGQYVVERIPAQISGTAEVGQGTAYGVYIEKYIVNHRSAAEAFQCLVREPLDSWCLNQTSSEPVILLVDALDEALRLDRHPNIVDLITTARGLPNQVHWLLTSRPGDHIRSLPGACVEILDASDENQDDVKAYVDAFLEEPLISKAMQESGMERNTFCEELMKHSSGNFLYLYYIFNSIRENATSARPLLTFGRLPSGLVGIYDEFLERILLDKPQHEWKSLYRPVLGTLAVAREELPFDLLVSLSGISSQELNDALNDLKQFLDLDRGENSDCYRIYHTSFADFLTDRAQNPARWIEAESQHHRIADYYLRAWGGMENGLRTLYQAKNLDPKDDYGLRYLPTHLEGANRSQDLHHLLELAVQGMFDLHPINVWFALKARSGQLHRYQTDIELAWARAKLTGDIGLQIRCALCLSSVRNVSDIPVRLLGMALKYHVFTSQQALDFSQLYREPIERAQALSRLIPLLQGVERADAIGDACEIAIAHQHAEVLIALAPHLPEQLLIDVLDVTNHIVEDRYRTKVLSAVSAHVPERDLNTVKEIAGSIVDDLLRARVLCAVAARRFGSERDEALREIMAIVEAMPDESDKVQALCEVAKCQEGKQRTETLDQALLIAGRLDYWRELAVALGVLAFQDLTTGQIDLALRIAAKTEAEEDHPGTLESYASVLSVFGPLLTERQRAEFVGRLVARLRAGDSWPVSSFFNLLIAVLSPYLTQEQRMELSPGLVVHLIRGVAGSEDRIFPTRVSTTDWKRHAALKVLSKLPEHLLETAVSTANEVQDNANRADILSALVPRLSQDRCKELLRAEIKRVQALGDDHARTHALVALVGHIPVGRRSELAENTLSAVQKLTHSRFKAIAKLAPHLSDDSREKIIQEALMAVTESTDSRSRSETIVTLSPILSGGSLIKALEIAKGLDSTDYPALAALIPSLPKDQRHALIDRVLSATQGWVAGELPDDFVKALKAIAPYLDETQLTSAFKTSKALLWGKSVEALAVLAPWLDKEQIEEALKIVRQVPLDSRGDHCARALAELSLRLTGDERITVLSESLTVLTDGRFPGIHALPVLAPQLPEAQRVEVLSESLTRASEIDEDDRRAETLVALLPTLSNKLWLEALNQMLASCVGTRLVSDGFSRTKTSIHRAFLLRQIADTAGTIANVGGESVVLETVRAIGDTAAWWP